MSRCDDDIEFRFIRDAIDCKVDCSYSRRLEENYRQLLVFVSKQPVGLVVLRGHLIPRLIAMPSYSIEIPVALGF